MKNNETQRGSVLIYILIAVALFAALGYVVAQMMRGSGNIGDEKTGVEVSGVLGYAQSLREGVQSLLISNGCTDTTVSFERSPYDSSDPLYVNLSAAGGFSCHVFHPSGGGISIQKGKDQQQWQFTGVFGISGVGSDEFELVAVLPVSRGLCDIINKRLEVLDSAVKIGQKLQDGSNADGSYPPFQGVYSSAAQIEASAYEGKMAGCFLSENSDGKTYSFYQVLIAR